MWVLKKCLPVGICHARQEGGRVLSMKSETKVSAIWIRNFIRSEMLKTWFSQHSGNLYFDLKKIPKLFHSLFAENNSPEKKFGTFFRNIFPKNFRNFEIFFNWLFEENIFEKMLISKNILWDQKIFEIFSSKSQFEKWKSKNFEKISEKICEKKFRFFFNRL